MASFTSENSAECTKEELDLFTVHPTQTSIDSGIYTEYNPISSIADSIPIVFNIKSSGVEYLDLTNSIFYVKAKITKEGSGPLTGDDKVGPVNNLLHSLFSEVDLKLNDTLITNNSNAYPYRAYLETLLSYGADAKELQLTSALFYKDVAGAMDDHDPTDKDIKNRGFQCNVA